MKYKWRTLPYFFQSLFLLKNILHLSKTILPLIQFDYKQKKENKDEKGL
jgi:hypothetical protein